MGTLLSVSECLLGIAQGEEKREKRREEKRREEKRREEKRREEKRREEKRIQKWSLKMKKKVLDKVFLEGSNLQLPKT
ncbi:hypothetical protein DUI87_05334 [Hirundo rustica rustica]|uniref:Uncharacterized protein n=1 Tax=Hirundo rustica rustica TaxID=333673 RepID=A0A3M0L3X8_HIRRU|nr:hypothetical protein DUI87_05334 [Hirundo rustica rustica]